MVATFKELIFRGENDWQKFTRALIFKYFELE